MRMTSLAERDLTAAVPGPSRLNRQHERENTMNAKRNPHASNTQAITTAADEIDRVFQRLENDSAALLAAVAAVLIDYAGSLPYDPQAPATDLARVKLAARGSRLRSDAARWRMTDLIAPNLIGGHKRAAELVNNLVIALAMVESEDGNEGKPIAEMRPEFVAVAETMIRHRIKHFGMKLRRGSSVKKVAEILADVWQDPPRALPAGYCLREGV